MNKVLTLMGLELRGLYGLNKFRYTKNKKEKNRYRLLMGVMVYLILMLFAYVGSLVYGLCSLELGSIVPAYLTVTASLLVFAFGIFKAGNTVFAHRGYDLLASLPVRPGSIVMARFGSMYAEDLLVTLLVFVPGAAVYGYLQQPGPGFFLMLLPGVLLIPAIPLVASTLVGTLIMALSSRMRHKSLVQSVLMVGFVVAVLLASFGMGDIAGELTPEALADLAKTGMEAIGKLYPPALWLSRAAVEGEPGSLLLFAGLSVGLVALSVWVAACRFHSIMGKLMSFSSGKRYTIGKMDSKGMGKALYLRELRRYFASSIYVTNTIIGPIMGCILAGALCFAGLDTVTAAFPLDVKGLIPFAIAGVFCMMTTTSTAISMEGKQFWIIRSMPIPAKALFDAKILLNLSLMLPFFLLTEIFLVIAVRPGLLELLWLLLIPAEIAAFSVVFGITVNRKFHSFDWEKEGQVVKQSASAALGGFSGFFLAILLAVPVCLVPTALGGPVRAAECLLLAGATLLLYRQNNHTRLDQL